MRKGTGRTCWRTARVIGLVVTLILAGLVPGGPAVADTQRADVTLGYTCRFPSSSEQVSVRFTGAFPVEARAGSLIRPESVSVTVTVSPTALPRPSASGSSVVEGPVVEGSVVEGSATLETLVTQAGRPVAVEWPGLTIPKTTVIKDGDLSLAASGPVPPTAASAGGEAVFSAGGLGLRLSYGTAGGADPVPPNATVGCTPNLGQNTTLVAVPVAGAGKSPAGTAPMPSAPGGMERGTDRGAAAADPGSGEVCPPMPEGGYNPRFPLPEWEPGAEPQAGEPLLGCALLGGHANVEKLKGASKVGGKASVVIGKDVRAKPVTPGDLGYLQVRSIAKSYLDTTRATFLTFGFMPTTAKMELTQVGNANIVQVGSNGDGPTAPPNISTVSAEVSIRLFDVEVNGSPMDVGPDCRTARPVALVLTGSDKADPPYKVNTGGRLTGTAQIPPFSGCGTGEDLDRLFTASVSGPGNHVELFQGPVCDAARGDSNTLPCPPSDYGYTITPGGGWKSTSGPVDLRIGLPTRRTNVRCLSSTLTGTFRGGSRVPPERLGQITGMEFASCAGTGLLPGPVTVEPVGLPAAIGHKSGVGFDRATGILAAELKVEGLRVAAGACRFDIAVTRNGVPVRYSNGDNSPDIGAGELKVNGNANIGSVKDPAGCPPALSGTNFVFSLVELRYPGLGQRFSYGSPPN